MTTDPATEPAARGDWAPPTRERLQAFVTHLAQPQSTVAAEMCAAGLEVVDFWGPEQMDVWLLVLAHGPVRVRFGIERGFSDWIQLTTPRLRDRRPHNSFHAYEAVSLVWTARTGRALNIVDPLDLRDVTDYGQWRAVLDWLASEATDADVATIDALVDLLSDHSYAQHRALVNGRELHPLPLAERVAAVMALVNPT